MEQKHRIIEGYQRILGDFMEDPLMSQDDNSAFITYITQSSKTAMAESGSLSSGSKEGWSLIAYTSGFSKISTQECWVSNRRRWWLGKINDDYGFSLTNPFPWKTPMVPMLRGNTCHHGKEGTKGKASEERKTRGKPG